MPTKTLRAPRLPKVTANDYSMNIKVPPELLPLIDREAHREGLTRSAVLRRLLMRTYGDAR